MPKLPRIKAKDLVKFLSKEGYILDHVQGSHHIMRNESGRKTSVAIHGNKEIPKGTLLAIIKDLEISKDDFVKALKKK